MKKTTTLLLVALATPLISMPAYAQVDDAPAGNSKYPSYDDAEDNEAPDNDSERGDTDDDSDEGQAPA